VKGLVSDALYTLKEAAQEDCAEGFAVRPKLSQYFPQDHPRR
jgi:hypothetical protein